jgi:Flp pilus assembly protein TadD
VRINLAFVVGLEGRVAEAENIVKAGLTPDEATANVTYLRRLLARKDKDGKDNARSEARIPVASAARDD